jgi:carboxymethylenebutenolidase
MEGIQMATLTIDTIDGPMEVFDAQPEMAPKGAVIVLQEAFGVTDHIKDICGRFASEGYRAVAPHLFHRSGDPVLGYDEFPLAKTFLAQLDQPDLLTDMTATIDRLSQDGFRLSQIAAVGFCMGGSVSLLAAASWPLGAAVSYYGGGVAEGRFGMLPLVELIPKLQSPWLGLYGEADPTIPVAQVEMLRRALGGTPELTDLVSYPEASHGFNCDARDSYHEPSAKDAWVRTAAWLRTNLADS